MVALPHVLLDAIELRLELGAANVHVGDDSAHHPHDGGKDEHAHQEVDDDKDVLPLRDGAGNLPNGGEGQCGPVEAHQVLAGELGIRVTYDQRR